MNKHEFKINDTVYVVERDPDGKPKYVTSWLLFVAQVGHVAILKNNASEETYTEDELISSLVYDTVCDEADILAFPIKDCYHSLEAAQRAVDIFHFTEGTEYELR